MNSYFGIWSFLKRAQHFCSLDIFTQPCLIHRPSRHRLSPLGQSFQLWPLGGAAPLCSGSLLSVPREQEGSAVTGYLSAARPCQAPRPQRTSDRPQSPLLPEPLPPWSTKEDQERLWETNTEQPRQRNRGFRIQFFFFVFFFQT